LEELNQKKLWINILISKVKDELQFRTSSTVPEDVDFYRIMIEREQIKKFVRIVNKLKEEKEIDKKEIRGFQIVASAKRFTSATQLKKVCRRTISLVSAFHKYDSPFEYLKCLQSLDIEETELYKFFVDIK